MFVLLFNKYKTESVVRDGQTKNRDRKDNEKTGKTDQTQ